MRTTISILTLATVLLIAVAATAQNKVVVIPLKISPAGQTNCSGQFVDTMNNPNFCGNCTTTCGSGNYCSQGVCKKRTSATCSTHSECLSEKCTTEGTCAPESKFVFVSSAEYDGDLRGLSGADSKCQGLAEAAGLPGTYKAWLSSNATSSPSTRFTRSTIPYVLVDGSVVATDWGDLTDNDINHYIDIDEFGLSHSTFVWTNTTSAGLTTSSSIYRNCIRWGFNGIAADGEMGHNRTYSQWTRGDKFLCSNTAPIYCFEQ